METQWTFFNDPFVLFAVVLFVLTAIVVIPDFWEEIVARLRRDRRTRYKEDEKTRQEAAQQWRQGCELSFSEEEWERIRKASGF